MPFVVGPSDATDNWSSPKTGGAQKMTIFIAAYAAVISTVAVAWQIYSWHRMHKTKIRVQMVNAYMTFPGKRVIAVEARNDNDHAIRVTSWGLETNDGSGQQLVIVQPLSGSTLPGPIPPHDSGSGYHDWDDLVGSPRIDFKRPVVAFVNLATGERFRSKPTTLAA